MRGSSSTIRMRVIASPPRQRLGPVGGTTVKVLPRPAALTSSMRPRCAPAIASTMASPSPAAADRAAARPGKRSKIARLLVARKCRAPRRAPRVGARPSSTRRADPDRVPSGVCCTAFWASCSTAWVRRWRRRRLALRARFEPPVARSPARPPSPAGRRSGRRPRRCRLEEVRLLRAWPASAGRRRCGSSGRARRCTSAIVSRRSSGSSSSSSRWPRTIVIGVRTRGRRRPRTRRCVRERPLEPVEHRR